MEKYFSDLLDELGLVEARANAGRYLYLRDPNSRLQMNHRELGTLNSKRLCEIRAARLTDSKAE